MSYTFTLTSRLSELSVNFYPPIELDGGSRHGLGLIGFYSYNSIFNVDETNNIFRYRVSAKDTFSTVHIPLGAYEIDEIYAAMLKAMNIDGKNYAQIFTLRANNNTLKCEILSKYEIDFRQSNSIGSLLGFERINLKPNKNYESTLPVDIMKVRMIRVDCNIICGAYLNAEQSHTLFEFDIDVEPGYKLTKEPPNIIYLPVRSEKRQLIDNITLRILDDNGDLIDFRGEKIIVRLELKKV